jgi:hypothetical protein
MGNGLFGCKGCNEYCIGRTRVEINNNLYGNYGEMQLDKSKPEQRIITNIFIPNCKLEFSPKNSKISQIGNNSIQKKSKKSKMKAEQNWDNNIKDRDESPNNFTNFFNEANKNDKNTSYMSPSLNLVTTRNNNNQSNNKIAHNNFNIQMLNFLNKLRNNPKSVIEDIDNIIKNNIKKIDENDYFISDNTKEIIKLNFNFERIKEILNEQEPVDILKINHQLKINIQTENTELTERKINELLIQKKREIINDYPDCFFYPIFMKDIKINIIILLENNKIREKILDNDFTEFFATTFNEKRNRFFAILCFA